MPRVTDAHRSARRKQILEAAWRCFIRDGFHGASMQDIFNESGLSAGAVYRYFPSKLDLIRATAETVWGGLGEAFDELERSEPILSPPEAFRHLINTAVRDIMGGDLDFSRMAVHVWAEALREPEVGALVRQVGLGIRKRLTIIAARWKSAGFLQTDADPEDVARAVYGVLVGFVIQLNVIGDVSADEYVAGLEALLNSPHTVSQSEEPDQAD